MILSRITESNKNSNCYFNMKRLLIILLIFFITSCTENTHKPRPVFYFYNDIGEFEKSQTTDGMSFSMRQGKYSIDWGNLPYPGKEPCIYSLYYFSGDMMFTKKKSYLDSIRHYDFYWIENDSNLQDFWIKKKYGSSRRKDTLEIYLIEKVANTDSILFRRVQRIFSDPK